MSLLTCSCIFFRGEVLATAGTEEMIVYSDIGEVCLAVQVSGSLLLSGQTVWLSVTWRTLSPGGAPVCPSSLILGSLAKPWGPELSSSFLGLA